MNEDKGHDSAPATRGHIRRVASFLMTLADEIEVRGDFHDESKLKSPEKEIFDLVTPRLKNLHYGSDEYKQSLADMGEALKHHYESNRHHPEHWLNGILDMDLVDIIEMFCDWCAATERHDDGDIGESIRGNAKRFSYGPILKQIFLNTARNYEMGKGHEKLGEPQ